MKRALILSGIKWDTTMQRHHMIATRLIELGYEVYFIEGIVSSSFSLKKVFNRLRSTIGRRLLVSPVTLPRGRVKVITSNFVNPQGGLFELYNKHKWSKIKNRLPGSFDLVINYLPISTTEIILHDIVVEYLIYDCVRDFSNWEGYPRKILESEAKLINLANCVTLDSYYLYDKMTALYPNKMIKQILPMLKDGQEQIFADNKTPSRIKNVSYIGQVGEHVDTSIFDELIANGYKVHLFGDSLLDINSAIEVHGFISDPSQLAREIIASSDALIIPYRGNMDGVIPAKLFECLATGLPVYVSNFYDARKLKDMIYVYNDKLDLLAMMRDYNLNEQTIRNNRTQKYLNNHSTQHELDIFDRLLGGLK